MNISFLIFFSSRKSVNANQAPKKGEKVDDKVSHRFQLFLDNKQHAEELKKNSKKKNKNKFKQDTPSEDNQYPHLEQKPNESDRNYLQRLDSVRLEKELVFIYNFVLGS